MVRSRSCSCAAFTVLAAAVLLFAAPAIPVRAAEAKPAEKAADEAMEAKLDRPLPEVNFKGHSLWDVINFTRDVTGADIVADWKALEAAGVKKNTPITARPGGATFRAALKEILGKLGDGKAKVGWTVKDRVIVISTTPEAKPEPKPEAKPKQ